MRQQPLDRHGQPAILSRRDVESSNATLNTLFGGARQKSWMTGAAAASVRPTPRVSVSRPPAPPVTQTHRTTAAVLPSPTPSDEPSPTLTPTRINGGRIETLREPENNGNGNGNFSTTIIRSAPVQDSHADTTALQSTRGFYQSGKQTQGTSDPEQRSNQPQFQSRDSDRAAGPHPSQLPTDNPALPPSVLLPSNQQLQSGRFPQETGSPATAQEHTLGTSLAQAASPPWSNFPLQSQQSSSAQTGAAQRRVQEHDQLPSPQPTHTSSPIATPGLPLPSTIVSNASSPEPGYDNSSTNSHKRQRTQALVMRTLQTRVPLIEAYINSVGGVDTLNLDVEQPRFDLLKNACMVEDSFYVALHQIFCLWNSPGEGEIRNIPNFPDTAILRPAFKILGQLIRDNERISPNHRDWFASFPNPLTYSLNRPGPYRNAIDLVGRFLGKLASEWAPFQTELEARGYPPLVEELVYRLGLLSTTLQTIAFTASRRNLGLSDTDVGMSMEQTFKADQQSHEALSARVNTASPPMLSEINDRRQWIVSQYLTIRNNALARRAARLQRPVVQGNDYSQAGNPNQNLAPYRQQNPINRNLPSNLHFSPQQNQAAARAASAPNLSNIPGRPGSNAAQRAYTNAPSPTLLQGFSIQSSLQQNFPAVQSNQYVAQYTGQYSPAGSQFAIQQQQQQQQQQQFAAQQQVQAQWQQGFAQNYQTSQNQGQAVQQQQQQQQQALLHQQIQHNQAQQFMNPNRAAQLRRDSNPTLNDVQQRTHSRTNSISSNGRQTPNMNTRIAPSARPGMLPAARPPINPSNEIQTPEANLRAYQQMNPRERPIIPPLGYFYPAAAINPDMSALHQAHLRSPRLVPADESSVDVAPNDPASRYYQAVKGFALSPTIIPSDGPLSKYEFSIFENDFSRIPTDAISGDGELATRAFTRGTLQYRLRVIRLNKTETECSISRWIVQDTLWPEGAALQLNKNQLEIRRKTHHGKDLPIDVTQFMRLAGSASINRISLSVTRGRTKLKEFNYFLAVEIIEILQHDQIMDMCQQQRIPAEDTLNSIKKSLTAGDDDELAMMVSDLSINLVDPWMQRIFTIPVRASGCLHRECFDLKTFLETRTSKPKRPQQPCMIDVWKCPVCEADARPYSLRVDDFMVSVRKRLADENKLNCRAILISADGNWRPQNMKRSRSPNTDSDDVDSNVETQQRTNGGEPNGHKKAVVVIALDD